MNGGKRERYPLNYWMAQIFFLQVLLDIHHKVLYLTPVYDSSSAKNKVFLVCSADWRRPRQQTRLIVEYLTFGKRPPISIYKELDGKWPRNPESIPFLLRLAIILQIRFITLRLLPVTSRRWYVKIADPNMRSRFLGRPPLPPPLSSNSDHHYRYPAAPWGCLWQVPPNIEFTILSVFSPHYLFLIGSLRSMCSWTSLTKIITE